MLLLASSKCIYRSSGGVILLSGGLMLLLQKEASGIIITLDTAHKLFSFTNLLIHIHALQTMKIF